MPARSGPSICRAKRLRPSHDAIRAIVSRTGLTGLNSIDFLLDRRRLPRARNQRAPLVDTDALRSRVAARLARLSYRRLPARRGCLRSPPAPHAPGGPARRVRAARFHRAGIFQRRLPSRPRMPRRPNARHAHRSGPAGLHAGRDGTGHRRGHARTPAPVARFFCNASKPVTSPPMTSSQPADPSRHLSVNALAERLVKRLVDEAARFAVAIHAHRRRHDDRRCGRRRAAAASRRAC